MSQAGGTPNIVCVDDDPVIRLVVCGGRTCQRRPAIHTTAFEKSERRVGTYYFYIHDPEFGAGFIKICT